MTTKESECKIPIKIDFENHWNAAYTNTKTEKLGWYEKSSKQTLNLISKTKLPKNAKILNVGSGSSMLIDELLAADYTNLIATDLSEKALSNLNKRLGKRSENVSFIIDDLTAVKKLDKLQNIDLWNDRAVLHFFLKEEEQNAYFQLLKKVVAVNGYVIIAVFALDGAEKCCGLDLKRYNSIMLQEKLGSKFELIEEFKHIFVNPNNGKRPYIYAMFKRKSK